MTTQPAPVLQSRLPYTPWSDPALSRMPGMRPVDGPWIVVDDAYAGQIAERARLMDERPAAVMDALPEAGPALAELRETVLDALPPGFRRDGGTVRRPDGVAVALDGPTLPLLNRLIQEDLLILLPRGGEHLLVAGLLCFPANWTLADKMGRPLRRIHAPVAEYDDALAARVQRLFDRAPAGRPMWRANVLAHADAVLHHPRQEDVPRDAVPLPPPYLRSERQTVLRLPRSGAVLFAVHTTVIAIDALTPAQRVGCPLLPSTEDRGGDAG